MADTIAKRFEDVGLPYEVTNGLNFVLSGAQKGCAVVALYHRGEVNRAFAGFYYDPIEASPVAKAANKASGCHKSYLVQANEKV